jgi:hypothetical protein
MEVYTIKKSLHLVLEYSKYDLEMIIKDKKIVFMPADIKSWLFMLLRGIDYCHRHWVLHRVSFRCRRSLLFVLSTLSPCRISSQTIC